MSDDSDPDDSDAMDQLRQIPAGWSIEQELEIASEVYGPEPKGHRAVPADLTDEEMVERFTSLLGFDVEWE